MTRQRVQKLITQNGDPLSIVPNAELYVFIAGTGTLATLYNQKTGGTIGDNPQAVGADGLAEFYIDPGLYDLVAEPSGGGSEIASFDDFSVLDEELNNRSQYVAAEFADVANMIAGTSQNLGVVDWADYLEREVSVVINNSTTKLGSAPYEIVDSNPGNLSTLNGSVWEGRNHDLGGGFYAKLNAGITANIYQFGVVNTSSTSAIAAFDAYVVEQKRQGEAKLLGVDSENSIASLNPIYPSTINSSAEGKSFYVTATTNGLENTLDTIEMADGRFANRSGEYKAERLGTYVTSPSLGHRCGDFLYNKKSQTQAQLLTDLSRYIPYTIDDVDDPNLTVGYVDWQKGNDNSGDGLTWATAKASLASGQGLNTDILLVRGGFYNRVNRLTGFTVSKDRSFIAVGGPVIHGVLATGTWTKTGGQTNVYQLDYVSGLTNVTNQVFDTAILNSEFAPTKYTSESSIADVDANPGTFYHTGTTTYVHAVNSRDLVVHGDELRLTQPVSTAHMEYGGNHRFYMKGFESWGGSSNSFEVRSDGSEWVGSSYYNDSCSFNGSNDGGTGNGLAIRDIGVCISENSACYSNRRDGFNYHYYLQGAVGVPGLNPHFVEINCQSHGNGEGGSEGNNQGSTSHERCIGFRINGDYSGHADGGCVADIEASKTYMVCNTTNNSSRVGALLSCDEFESDPASLGVWWIDGHSASDNNGGVIGNARGDVAMDGFRSRIHMADTATQLPISTRTFSTPPDRDFT